MFRKQKGAKGGGVAAAGLKAPQGTRGDLEESLAQLTVTRAEHSIYTQHPPNCQFKTIWLSFHWTAGSHEAAEVKFCNVRLDDCDISGEESGKFFAPPSPSQESREPCSPPGWHCPLCGTGSSSSESHWHQAEHSLSSFLGSWHVLSCSSSFPSHGAVQQAGCTGTGTCYHQDCLFLRRT